MAQHLFQRIRRIPYTPYLFVVVPPIVAAVRIIEEEILYGFGSTELGAILNVYTCYLLLQLLLTASLRIASGLELRDVAGAATLGMVLGWLPPLIDLALPAGGAGRYAFFRDISWTFMEPYQMTGETITLWLGVAAAAVYVGWLTRSFWRSLLAALLVYVSLQVFMTLIFLLARWIGRHTGMTPVPLISLLGLAGCVLIYIALNPRTLFPSVLRFNHALPWGLVTAAGAKMAGAPLSVIVIKGLLMTLTFQLVVFANDYFDRGRDEAAGGLARPVSSDDVVMIFLFKVYVTLVVLQVYPPGFVLLILFFCVWTAYHHPALEFKRLFCLGYKVEGVAAAACFLFGTQGAGDFFVAPWVPILAILVPGGFSLGSMFKDYKDIDQDREAGIGTIYTRLQKRGVRLEKIHWIVLICLLLMLLVPPVWLALLKIPLHHLAPLFLAAPIPAALLKLVRNRKAAVESAMWALSLYLGLLVFLLPKLA